MKHENCPLFVLLVATICLGLGCAQTSDRHYGDLLSGFAHGGVVKAVFRIRRQSPTGGTVVMGNEYDQKSACFVGNQLVALLFGFLNKFEGFFPKNTLGEDAEVQIRLKDSQAWLEKCMEADKRENRKSKEWYQHMARFIR